MAWKPKEKELTPEEAIAQAKKELEPYWHLSEPMLYALRDPSGTTTVLPLDPEFGKKTWVIHFVDPVTFAGENFISFIRLIEDRYGDHGLSFLTVIRPTHRFLLDRPATQALMKHLQIQYPAVVDHDGGISAAFGATQVPHLILLKKGQVAIARNAADWSKGTEIEFQKFLRQTDPGLPLPMPHVPAAPYEIDRGELKLPHPEVQLTGQWKQDGDLVMTSDPDATLTFQAKHPGVSLLAQSMAKTSEPARIQIEVAGVPPYDAVKGTSVQFDDEGQALARVEGPRLYHVLRKLPSKDREITLRFPTADRIPAGIYAIRFSGTA